MSPRPASTEPLAIGIIAGELATTAAGGGPEWIKVTPRGPVKTRDGRSYAFNPETLTARFQADAIDIPLDLDHALAHRATKGERVDAVGYASELQARDDGLYARVNWLDGGLAVLSARTHRYVSPTFPHDAAGNATWLHSISLVAAPALSMPALLHALGYPENPMKQIAKALGLAEDADEAACLASLNGRLDAKSVAQALKVMEGTEPNALLAAIGAARGGLTDIAKALGINEQADAATCLAAIGTLKSGGNDVVATLQANLQATTASLSALQKSVREKDVSELIEGGLKDRKIAPAQREHLVKLCATDEGLATVRAMLGATAPGLQASGLGEQSPGTGDDAVNPATLAAEANTLMDERRAAGRPIGIAEAVGIVQARKTQR